MAAWEFECGSANVVAVAVVVSCCLLLMLFLLLFLLLVLVVGVHSIVIFVPRGVADSFVFFVVLGGALIGWRNAIACCAKVDHAWVRLAGEVSALVRCLPSSRVDAPPVHTIISIYIAIYIYIYTYNSLHLVYMIMSLCSSTVCGNLLCDQRISLVAARRC